MGKLTQSTAEIQEILNGYNALKEQVKQLAAAAPAVDETLMKYLANPYQIKPGVRIPEDLHNLIYVDGLRPVVMSVCVFHEMADSTYYAIVSNSEWVVYLSNGTMINYNDLDRVFDY